MDKILAKIALQLACAGPLVLVWMAVAHPASPGHMQRFVNGVTLALALASPAGIALGAGLLFAAQVRDGGRRLPPHARAQQDRDARYIPNARAAMVVGFGACVVTALIFPTVAQQPRHYSHWSCLSNVKQLGLAFQMYAQDYDDRLPMAAGWNETTMPYIKNDRTYRCPEEERQALPSYGLNGRLAQYHLPQLAASATTVLLTDSNPGKDQIVSLVDYPFGGRHRSFVSVGFADGHAKAVHGDNVLRLKWTPHALREIPGLP